MKRLLFLIATLPLGLSATGQEIQTSIQFGTIGHIEDISVLNVDGDTWIGLATRERLHWSTDAGRTWITRSFQDIPRTPRFKQIATVGDSSFVFVGESSPLLRLSRISPDLEDLGYVGARPFDLLESSDGVWHLADFYGMSRSVDGGKSWTPTDTLYQSFTISVKLFELGDGVLAAVAESSAGGEGGHPSVHYSLDGGSTWRDSTYTTLSQVADWTTMLATSGHVQLIFNGNRHFARRNWSEALVSFESNDFFTDVTYSTEWGVVAAGEEGLYRLDENNLSWHRIFSDFYTRRVTAGSEGTLYFSGWDRLWRLTTVSTDLGSEQRGWSPGELSVYPNPAYGILRMHGVSAYARYDVINVQGRIVTQLSGGALKKGVSIGQLPPGLYLVMEVDGSSSRRRSTAFINKGRR